MRDRPEVWKHAESVYLFALITLLHRLPFLFSQNTLAYVPSCRRSLGKLWHHRKAFVNLSHIGTRLGEDEWQAFPAEGWTYKSER